MKTLSTESILEALDQRIADRSILRHPFYRAWQAGSLDREQLATYAAVYYPHVAAFPEHLQIAAERATDAVVRAELLANLAEELSEPKAHPELWLQFAERLGADRDALRAAPASHGAATAIVTFRTLCARSSASALAALYAYESQQPEVSREKAEGLRRLYGISDAEALEYFEVHSEADVRHRAGERRAIARCLEQGATSDEVLTAADQALDAYSGLLDEVCEQAGIHAC